ncbi:hypothetical protein BT63DRAFT_444037 [Microthyrium microscopicum]|uniref:Uncharacterized protein n=1 Tax=Microthyrium microscopicum TaxID=703497 RepID=A0A6A6U017_9PEZI|nr:hypothetical protein BT63DRAFT_444037 [Microthyrium microscopicum]
MAKSGEPSGSKRKSASKINSAKASTPRTPSKPPLSAEVVADSDMEDDEEEEEEESEAEGTSSAQKATRVSESPATSGAEESEDESSENEAAPAQQPAPSKSHSQQQETNVFSTSDTIRPAKPFVPPLGFAPAETATISSALHFNAETLQGKELFYISAPANVPMEELTALSWQAAEQGEEILSYRDTSYGLTFDDATRKGLRVLLPAKGGYRSVHAKVQHVLHMQEIPNLKRPNPDPLDREHPNKIPRRRQPKGMRMRFKPMGFGAGDIRRGGEAEDDVAFEDIDMMDAPPLTVPEASGQAKAPDNPQMTEKEKRKQAKKEMKKKSRATLDVADGAQPQTMDDIQITSEPGPSLQAAEYAQPASVQPVQSSKSAASEKNAVPPQVADGPVENASNGQLEEPALASQSVQSVQAAQLALKPEPREDTGQMNGTALVSKDKKAEKQKKREEKEKRRKEKEAARAQKAGNIVVAQPENEIPQADGLIIPQAENVTIPQEEVFDTPSKVVVKPEPQDTIMADVDVPKAKKEKKKKKKDKTAV